jgi:60 kDa SS-A/Ro ribonucleoprotein
VANKSLFSVSAVRATDAVNEAGGTAYRLAPKHALAQYVMTGCLNGTFYASAKEQLDDVLLMAGEVEPEFVAKLAVAAREKGFMKDMPALLLAVLSVRSPGLMAEVFDRVVDNTKMLRNFVQIVRSGVVGRKSLGSLPKRMVLQWLEKQTDEQLFRGSIGNDPSLADVVKMVHPKPKTASREAFYGWLLGREHKAEHLPECVKAFEAFKVGCTASVAREDESAKGWFWKKGTAPREVPDVPFQMLTALPLGKEQWKAIARNASWTTTRMNLNTFFRHGVFADGEKMARLIADRLRDRKEVKKARVFPYQLMMTALAAETGLPGEVKEALHDAMEVAVENVPSIDGNVYVLVDVSGSMHSPVTGHRAGATTQVRCIDVAALVAAAILRKNPWAQVMPFHDRVVSRSEFEFGSRLSVIENAKALTRIPSGGTDCSAPMKELVARRAKAELVIYVSDNESWMDSAGRARNGSGSQTFTAWKQFKQMNPGARLVCIDVQPCGTTQAPEGDDVLNVGGFSDQVFEVLAAAAQGRVSGGYWVGEIEKGPL